MRSLRIEIRRNTFKTAKNAKKTWILFLLHLNVVARDLLASVCALDEWNAFRFPHHLILTAVAAAAAALKYSECKNAQQIFRRRRRRSHRKTREMCISPKLSFVHWKYECCYFSQWWCACACVCVRYTPEIENKWSETSFKMNCFVKSNNNIKKNCGISSGGSSANNKWILHKLP